MKQRVVIAGGSGFLGKYLEAALIAADYEVAILTRSPRHANHVYWDGATLGEWSTLVNGAQAVVNLAGKSVDCRYTPENRREIIESRVNAVRVMNAAILKCQTPPPVLVQAATLAIYGNSGDTIRTEDSPAGDGFSPSVALQWEKAFYQEDLPQTRRVVLRIGFALGRDGGALHTLAMLARLFLGGTVGSGNQYISWLHMDDLMRVFVRSIEDETYEGIYNVASPSPVTNREFMKHLRRAVHRPWSPPTPALLVRIGSWFLRTEAELALTGRRCMPQRLTEQGFEFHYTDLDTALADVLRG